MEIKGIIKQSGWKTGHGVDPHCIVLLMIEKGGKNEYTTHEMVKRPGKKAMEFYSGHYYTEIEDALKDFNKRTK